MRENGTEREFNFMKRERSVDGSSDGLGRDILIMKPTWTDMVTEINLKMLPIAREV